MNMNMMMKMKMEMKMLILTKIQRRSNEDPTKIQRRSNEDPTKIQRRSNEDPTSKSPPGDTAVGGDKQNDGISKSLPPVLSEQQYN